MPFIENGVWRPIEGKEFTNVDKAPINTSLRRWRGRDSKRWRNEIEEEVGCDSIQKRMYKPDCATNQVEKDRRRKRINEVVREFTRMKYKDRSKFLRKIHERTAEEWWITGHYYIDFPLIQPNGRVLGDIKFSKEPLRGAHRQDIYKMITLNNINRIKLNKIPNPKSKLDRMFQLMESKILFHYDKRKFIRKINSIDEWLRDKRKEDMMINDGKFDRLGNEELRDILGIEIYNFLERNDVITEKLKNRYHNVFGSNGDDNLKMKLKKTFMISYTSRIELLFAILAIPRENEDVFIYNVENILKMELTMRIYQYIYYSNHYLQIEDEEIRKKMIEIAFEYVYYHYLNYYLDFCKMFLGCTDKTIINNRISVGKGAYGNVYEIEEEKGIIEKKIDNIRIEKTLFEFFKQICLNHEFPQYIPEPILFTMGKNFLYIKMEKIEGETLFSYFLENREFIELPINEKYEKIKNISIIISNLLFEMQQKMNFVHYDCNFRNIMINIHEGKIKMYLIDFDKTLLKINGIYIYTFNKYFEINIFTNDLFRNSIDLFRYIGEFFKLEDNIKLFKREYKNRNITNIRSYIDRRINNINLLKIAKIFYGIENSNINLTIKNIMKQIGYDYAKNGWPIYLSSKLILRYNTMKVLNTDLIRSNKYILNFVHSYFIRIW